MCVYVQFSNVRLGMRHLPRYASFVQCLYCKMLLLASHHSHLLSLHLEVEVACCMLGSAIVKLQLWGSINKLIQMLAIGNNWCALYSRCVYSFCLFFTFDITRYSGHVLCPGNVLLDLFKYCGHHHSIEEGSNYTPHFVRNGDESSCFPSLSIGIYIIPRTACNFQLPVEKRLSLSA